jgi:hypothetical protein
LLDKESLAAVMRPPDLLIPPVDRSKLFAPDSPYAQPFALFVRQFGSDESTAGRLLKGIQSWDAAGRPSSEGMQIRAYPKNLESIPSEGELVIEKQWTKLIIA